VSALPVAAGVLVVLGAVVGIAAREARVALLGLLVALLLAPFVADPLPGTLPLAVRIVGGTLAGYLLGLAARRSTDPVGSPLGLPATLAAAAAATAAGLAPLAVGLPQFGPDIALAAGLACLVLAVPAVTFGRDVFRLGAGLVVLLTGALLVRVGLIGTLPSDAEQVATALLVVVLGGAVATVAGAAISASGGLGLDDRPAAGRRAGGRS